MTDSSRRPTDVSGAAANVDPFAVLGIAWTSTLAEVREARRHLAFQLHPDHGGDVAAMQRLNAAFDACVGHVTHRRPLVIPGSAQTGASHPPRSSTRDSPPGPGRAPTPRRGHIEQDAPSFTIDALPPEAFEALLVVAATIGDVLDDDPPYVLECRLSEPAPCWCRLELVPDAGGSTVSLILNVFGDDDEPGSDGVDPLRVSAELVRDVWVDQLNQLGRLQP